MNILLIVAFIFAVLLIVIALRPPEFRISRSTVMAASPSDIFPHVNDLRRWRPWSPWVKLDPSVKSEFSGPTEGVGASMAWESEKEAGVGSMTITQSKPYELIQFRLDFIKPFKGTDAAEFTFQPEGTQTRVTWSMYGKNNFIRKAFGLVINCDKMVGPHYERGLADLKALVEGKEKS